MSIQAPSIHEPLIKPAPTSTWIRVCSVTDLEVERGRAALIDGEQVALFLLHGGRVHAVQQLDPFSGASVMSRGIVGSRGDIPTVAGPMYKQVFDLRTGMCLDTQGKKPFGSEPHGEHPTSLRVYPVSVNDAGDVLIRWKASA